jgi:uncharacterized membrane protein YfhO
MKQKKTSEKVEVKKELSFYEKYVDGKEFYYLLVLLLGISYIIFGDFISFEKVYLFKDIGSDSLNIYFPWLTATSDYLKHESTLGWSFSQGMGQNLFPLWIGDFFSNFLTYFDKSEIPYYLVLMEILKIFLSGFVFYKFLKELKVSNFSSLIFSVLYAFSGFIILGGCWTIFSVEALYAAIILYGFERWLNHRKFFWFVLGIALMAFLQPFFLFLYAITLSAYAIVRYYDVYGDNKKLFFKFLLHSIGLTLLGVLISSYQLFADLLQYSESPRVGGEAGLFDKLKGNGVFELADEFLRFTTIFRSFGSDMLGTGSDFKGWQNYLEAPLFYCGIFCLVTFPQFFISLSKKQKLIYGSLTLVFCLPIFFPYFRYAFWAFTGDYFRTFSWVITFLLVMFSARALSFIESHEKINKIVLGVTVLILLLMLYPSANQYTEFINTDLRSFVSILIIVYALLLLGLTQKSAVKEISKISILILCVIEITYMSSITVNKRDVMTRNELNQKIGYNDYSVEAVAYLKKIDNGFFRVNKDFSSGLAIHTSVNDAKVQGYYGTSSYFSFNQKNYIKFLGDLNVIDPKDENSTRWARGVGDRPILFSLASGKYWLSKRTDNAIANIGFDSIAKFGDVKVYKNKYALPFGFTYNKIIRAEDFKKLSPAQKDMVILRACVIDKDNLHEFNKIKLFDLADTLAPNTFENYMQYTNELKKDHLQISKFSENNIVGTIHSNDAKILFFSIPFDEGWSALVNGNDCQLFKLNCGLTGMKISKGINKVNLSFTPRYQRLGLIVSFSSFILFIIILISNVIINKKGIEKSK